MMKMNSLWNYLIIALIMIIFIFLTNYLHPITMIILLLIYIMIICIIMSLNKFNFMYSIMVFLIMISGLLVIFLYFSSLISNEKMSISLNFPIFFSALLNMMILNLFLIFFNHTYKNTPSFSMEMNPMYKMNINLFDNILKIYIYPYNNLSLMCMFFLLISLFLIIKMCSIKSSSLRKIS